MSKWCSTYAHLVVSDSPNQNNCYSFVCLQAVVDAVLAIAKPNEPIDLYMVEIMEMKHKTDCDTQ